MISFSFIHNFLGNLPNAIIISNFPLLLRSTTTLGNYLIVRSASSVRRRTFRTLSVNYKLEYPFCTSSSSSSVNRPFSSKTIIATFSNLLSFFTMDPPYDPPIPHSRNLTGTPAKPIQLPQSTPIILTRRPKFPFDAYIDTPNLARIKHIIHSPGASSPEPPSFCDDSAEFSTISLTSHNASTISSPPSAETSFTQVSTGHQSLSSPLRKTGGFYHEDGESESGIQAEKPRELSLIYLGTTAEITPVTSVSKITEDCSVFISAGKFHSPKRLQLDSDVVLYPGRMSICRTSDGCINKKHLVGRIWEKIINIRDSNGLFGDKTARAMTDGISFLAEILQNDEVYEEALESTGIDFKELLLHVGELGVWVTRQ